jgi:predicted AlkP superfamily pyrophosphatase or phosphodiesterase
LVLPPGSVSPQYGSNCISEIPGAIGKLLDVELPGSKPSRDFLGDVDLDGIENVVLIAADGFGMNEWERQTGQGVARDLDVRGSVKAITTVFPSSTTSALTSLATGLTPQEHCLPEWFFYMKEVNSIVVSLPFSYMRDYGGDTLRGHAKPRSLFRGTPLFKELKASGVEVHSFTTRNLAKTVYTKLIHGASDIVPYQSGSDMVTSLRRTVESARDPSFSYVYWSHVDHIEHEFGPGTEEARLEAASISFLLHSGFVAKLDRRVAKRTLLVFTADHGQIATRPEDTLYLNSFRSLSRSFKVVKGKRVTPAGVPRDVFLYIDEGRVDEILELLRVKLAGRASVLKTDDAIKAGLFGLNRASTKFKERVGNLLILPYGNGRIWYKGPAGYELNVRGLHGGLSKDEMLIPLAVGRLSDLQGSAR